MFFVAHPSLQCDGQPFFGLILSYVVRAFVEHGLSISRGSKGLLYNASLELWYNMFITEIQTTETPSHARQRGSSCSINLVTPVDMNHP